MPVIPGGRLLRKMGGGHVGYGGGSFDSAKHPRSHGKFAHSTGEGASAAGKISDKAAKIEARRKAAMANYHSAQAVAGGAAGSGDAKVDDYGARLRHTQGTDAFDTVHAQLSAEPPDVVEKVTRSVTGRSAGSKAANLKSLRSVHTALRTFQKKDRFTAGRSAA